MNESLKTIEEQLLNLSDTYVFGYIDKDTDAPFTYLGGRYRKKKKCVTGVITSFIESYLEDGYTVEEIESELNNILNNAVKKSSMTDLDNYSACLKIVKE